MLPQDEKRLDEMSEQANAFLPQLRERAKLLQEELARERTVVAEIEECDQEDLVAWKDAIAEQQYVPDVCQTTCPIDESQDASRLESRRSKREARQTGRPEDSVG